MAAMGIKKTNHGFTLVELMIAIVIIGILMAIAIPAVGRAITTARQTAIRMEINALEGAVEQYMQKYGDYPPDGSSREVLNRHMRRLFPRMIEPDNSLLVQLTSIRGSTEFSVVAMDRAEALVFFLGGFSDNALHPLTGEGGPLELIPGNTLGSMDINHYQCNATRDNAFFDFDPARLTYARASDTSPLLSTDESVWTTAAELAQAGGFDVLPVYLSGGSEPAPIVYFDSRTYGLVTPGVYNGFLHPTLGGVRPYKTGRDIKPPSGAAYGSAVEAFAAIPFHKPKTFQIISPGLDGIYGSIVSLGSGEPVHFITETGAPVFPNAGAAGPAGLAVTAAGVGTKFQDVDWNPGITVNGHLDNITNFSSSTLGDDLQ